MNLQHSLEAVLPAARVRTRLIDRVAYANDASYFRLVPQAVVQPNSISEIQSLFQFTQRHRVPMTFRAAGTSLSGQAVTDGILVDITKSWDKWSVEENASLIRFGPAVVAAFLNAALKPHRKRIGPDPASIDACMMGGVLANNSSGMCCGVTENAYRTVHSMTFVLPNGFVLNTSAPNAAQIFENEQPHVAKGLLELKKRILESPSPFLGEGRGSPDGCRWGEGLAQRIATRYQQKNNNGYLLNAFLDFDSPLDILVHLLIGSEGTLGFIAEAVLHTLPEFTQKYTGQMYFKNIQDAASAIYPLTQSGARAAEIMDRASLRSVENLAGAPPILRELPDGATAILVEYQAESRESMAHFKSESARVIKGLNLLHDVEFTDDPTAQAALWKPRKGIIPSVGAMRPPRTSLITEDVVFPVERLADAVTDLQNLFNEHGYPDGVIFGHAKDGNLHFLVNQSFNSDEDTRQFDNFMRAMVNVVSGKYDGALKAEHGTGRNMSPFVETEWGAEAYSIMRDLKSLLDPDGMLSPDVVISDDPQAHVNHVKSLSLAHPLIDKCIECGFCESKCPSRRLTLSPRQRIVAQREISRLDLTDPARASLINDFSYAGISTCAADGLCATACPVSINTGDYIKHLRVESIKNESPALWIANHFTFVERLLGVGVTLGHLFSWTKWHSLIPLVEKLTRLTLPKWNEYIPRSDRSSASIRSSAKPQQSPLTNIRLSASSSVDEIRLSDSQSVTYFPSCISRQMGLSNGQQSSLVEIFVEVSRRAGVSLVIPPDIEGHCCGMPFGSKGYKRAYRAMLHKTVAQMWEWSEHGKRSIVIDTTSCSHTLRACADDLSDEDRELWKRLTILDGVEFLHDMILPRLQINRVDEDVVLHPNCSARKLNLQDKMTAIAQACAKSVTVPLNLGCCAYAGDRGMLFPELTRSATEKETAEVVSRDYGGYYSSNITCEIGMSVATKKNYASIAYLVEKASR